jgi:NADH-quinone oxidoreductase subunit L
MFASVAVAALGILVAYKKYARFDVSKPETEEGIIGNKFYIDELYDYVFVKSLKKISHFFDRVVDDKVVDGMIMLVCREFVDFGKKLAFLQNGNVRFYALYMLIGMSCAFLYLYTTLIGQ